MHVLREILRQKLGLQRSHRSIAQSLGVSVGKVAEVWSHARSMDIKIEEVDAMSDEALEQRFYPSRTEVRRPEPEYSIIHLELRKPGMTLALAHAEYLEREPKGLGYSAFCGRYREWTKRQSPVMRQTHKAGDKLFVDYAGIKPRLTDPVTGEITEVELFVAVLGASNYTYAEATRTQRVEDFVSSLARTLTFMGGVPAAIVPDQLKSAVVSSCRYDPAIQRTTAELARFYGTTILPARPKSPRDKAKVEVAVQIAERWLLACIRNETFATLGELNSRLLELTQKLNLRVMRTYQASRRELFERLERPALSPLPESPFEVSTWKRVRLNIDYHVEFDHHLYSAPYRYLREELWIRATASTVELYHAGERIAAHIRSFVALGRTTLAEHMPSSHRAQAEWSPSRILSWASKVGPNTHALCDAILQKRTHPELGYRACLGLFRLAQKYGDARVEAACARALYSGGHNYRHVSTILQYNLDTQPLPEREQPASTGIPHENIRGPDYYH